MGVSERLLARDVPGVGFATDRPVVSESGGHARRLVRATVQTPRGTVRHASETVMYSLPPADGDDPKAAHTRSIRHCNRDSNVCRRLGNFLRRDLYYLDGAGPNEQQWRDNC